MSAVLEPLLGFELARERANNIAQVLVFGVARDPAGVALGMLQGTGIADLRAVAEEVGHAWSRGVREMEARVPDGGAPRGRTVCSRGEVPGFG